MSTELVLLAVLMFAVTYPSRALGLLAPGIDRLPRRAFDYLQLVGPAVLAALAAVSVMVVSTDTGQAFHVGLEWLAVGACLAIVAWRRNLFLGLVTAVAIAVVGPARRLRLRSACVGWRNKKGHARRASASTSTRSDGSMRPATWTRVDAGRIAPNRSP